MTWRPDPFTHRAPHHGGAARTPGLALPHGWGPIVAAANAEGGFTEPARMPNGTHAPHLQVDHCATPNLNILDVD